MALHNLIEAVEQRDDKKVYAIVAYVTDDATFKVREEYTLDPPIPATLTTIVTRRMTELAAQSVDPAGLKALLSMTGQEIAVPVIEPPDPPSDADQAKAAWFALVSKLQRMAILSVDHPERVKLQGDVDSTFKSEFLA